MIDEIFDRAKKSITKSRNLKELDDLRVKFLGKNGEISNLLKNLNKLPKTKRSEAGKSLNQTKIIVDNLIKERKKYLEKLELENLLLKESIDISLPGRNFEIGGLHPITITLNRIQSIFEKNNFSVEIGPEIENDFYNFAALNIPSHHPARGMHDTFYFDSKTVLRTHTSPVQIRAMNNNTPPLSIISLGKVYRCDSDITHTPMFHQIEGLVVDKNINFSQLKGLLIDFLRSFFQNNNLAVRFRPSYFPFTEPSAEADIECVICNGDGCRVCKQTGWLEVLGCGIVHPNVLNVVDIDAKEYTGLAFGMGIERLAMLSYGVDDLRLFFENDIRFLRQFK